MLGLHKEEIIPLRRCFELQSQAGGAGETPRSQQLFMLLYVKIVRSPRFMLIIDHAAALAIIVSQFGRENVLAALRACLRRRDHQAVVRVGKHYIAVAEPFQSGSVPLGANSRAVPL